MSLRVLVDEKKGQRALDFALKNFKKMCLDDGLVDEMKERRFYVKPSDKKRKARKERQRTLQRLSREERKFRSS